MDLNNSIMGISDSNEMEDFGPIVSAPPAKLRSDIFVTDAVASSSNVKNALMTGGSKNNLEDLASVLGSNPIVTGKFRISATLYSQQFLLCLWWTKESLEISSFLEKKSTSDILALYGIASKCYPRSTKHQRRLQQFSEVFPFSFTDFFFFFFWNTNTII